MGAAAITFKRCSSALSVEDGCKQCRCVRKPVCNEGQGESAAARDQCAALFITAAVHQPLICGQCRVADCLPPASLAFFCCSQEAVLMMLAFITREGGRQAVGWAKTHREAAILITLHLKACHYVHLHFSSLTVFIVNTLHSLCLLWPLTPQWNIFPLW